jgi:hypothetical protein
MDIQRTVQLVSNNFHIADGTFVIKEGAQSQQVSRGIVLIPPELVEEAKKYGWVEGKSTPHDIKRGLRRVSR